MSPFLFFPEISLNKYPAVLCSTPPNSQSALRFIRPHTMSHQGEEAEGQEVEEVGPGGHWGPPHSPLQRSLPRPRKALPLFSPLPLSPLSPLPQHPPPPSPHPPRHPMPSLALPHAPHPQEALVQHQGLQSFRRWELCDVPPLMPSPRCHWPSFREWCLLPSLSLSLTSRLSFPPFYFFLKRAFCRNFSCHTWENGWITSLHWLGLMPDKASIIRRPEPSDISVESIHSW